MKNKKFLPLVILVGVVALLGILLAVLTLHGEAETDTTLPLCDLAADDIDALSYAGNNVEVSLLKGSDGWLLADDPSLPLDQTKVQSLVEDYANLKAQRKLEGNDLAELPAKSDTPQMTITLGAGEQTVDLTVDQLNSVADVYYVYDESGAAYTVPAQRPGDAEQVTPRPVQGPDADRQDDRRCGRHAGERPDIYLHRRHLDAGRRPGLRPDPEQRQEDGRYDSGNADRVDHHRARC